MLAHGTHSCLLLCYPAFLICLQLLPCIVSLEVVEGVLAKLRASLIPPFQALSVRVPRCVLLMLLTTTN